MRNRNLILFTLFLVAFASPFLWKKNAVSIGIHDRKNNSWKIETQHNAPHSGPGHSNVDIFRSIRYHYRQGPPYYKADISLVEFYSKNVESMVNGNEPVYCNGKLIFAQCVRTNEMRSAKLACMDANKSTQVINSIYFPELLPNWIKSESVKEAQLLGWYRNAAIFHGSCESCFYAFAVKDNYFNMPENSHNYLLGDEMPEEFNVDLVEIHKISNQIFDTSGGHQRIDCTLE